ncbi:unannotated protein [freshwater metagenome]|uniref:Unannotated protein n=1 Tax=freshwater metagenome TaxID=449393 RepID=A0A6J6Y657_9ZZZZ
MASSAPATSANVVCGVSFDIILALDLPKFITLEPPPCTWFIKKNNKKTMMAIGSKEASSESKTLSLGTLTL